MKDESGDSQTAHIALDQSFVTGRVSAFAEHFFDVELTNAQQPMNTKKQIKKACKAGHDAVFRGFCMFELSPYLHKVFHEN